MKIIVPTDFSDLSKVALAYAAHFASFTKNPLILVNNVVLESLPRAGVLINLEEKMEINAIEDLQELANWARKQVSPSPDIFCEISKTSNSALAVIQKAESNRAELIIMGTRGASGLTGSILGSVSAEVVRKSPVPVILVPESAKFETQGGIVFAVDPNDPPKPENLHHFNKICLKLNKNPEFFLCYSGNITSNSNEITNSIKSILADSNCIFHIHSGDDPVKAINEFTSKNPCMMIALDPAERSFFDRILGKSVSAKMIANSSVPIITLP